MLVWNHSVRIFLLAPLSLKQALSGFLKPPVPPVVIFLHKGGFVNYINDKLWSKQTNKPNKEAKTFEGAKNNEVIWRERKGKEGKILVWMKIFISSYQAVILRYVLLEVLELHLAGNSLEIIISSL